MCVCDVLCVWLASGISRERGRISRGAPWRVMTGLSWRSVLGRNFSQFRGFEGGFADFFFSKARGSGGGLRPPPLRGAPPPPLSLRKKKNRLRSICSAQSSVIMLPLIRNACSSFPLS